MKNILISIIIPVYNAENYLDECLESISKQKEKNIEIIVVNDGSIDKSLDIINKWLKTDSRFKLINQSNQGVSKARNMALKQAKGTYIMFMDSDDYISPSVIEKITETMKKKKVDLLCFGYNLCYLHSTKKTVDSSIKTSEDCIESIILGKSIKGYLWNKVFSKDIIKDNGILFDNSINYCEDFLFVMQYLKYTQKIAYINEAYYNYRMRKSGVSFTFYNKKNATIIKAYEKIINNLYINKYRDDLIFQYIFNYYKFRKIIKKTSIKVDYKLLKEEKRITKRIKLLNKIKLILVKYFPSIYSRISSLKNIFLDLYD